MKRRKEKEICNAKNLKLTESKAHHVETNFP